MVKLAPFGRFSEELCIESTALVNHIIYTSLANDDPEHFRIFANYIYSGNLGINLPQPAQVTAQNKKATNMIGGKTISPASKVLKASRQSKLIDLFIFGDSKLASSFKNVVIDKLLECVENDGFYHSKSINLVFEETTASSPLQVHGRLRGILRDERRALGEYQEPVS
jgi:hypothetical protein